ncbi:MULTISPECIES: hypothetical protein [unclassified Corallococcus]|uniref:hypothetical protein n=1 Tax=unclassified Corallococcus TaxID=2685029 RepID=UPI001A8D53DA|nr:MULTISPECIES: hypothetical protein [unclassified Corallococcus]MBN9688578.1 hypothetical protein [Corallococcus sp. NCSPR001]WAS87620.1 hypothetical protein O0N60_11745 [Corallococcus sp. NCRR]
MSRAGRVAGAGLCLLLGLSARAHASPDAGVPDAGAPAEPRFAWPRLQVIAHVESSDIVEAGGIPVALRAVHVKENIRDLVQRFADAFRDGGLYVPPGKEQAQYANNAAMLTALDPKRRITYTVVMMPHADGTTTLYLGEANHALARPQTAAGDFAPLPPQANGVLRVNAEGSRTLTFQVPLTGPQVEAFYEDALAKAGWKRGDEPGAYSRPGAELRLTHQPSKDGQRGVVLIYQQRAR